MIALPDGTKSEECLVTHFWNSADRYQLVTDGPEATCPTCGYPERHRLYEDAEQQPDPPVLSLKLVADGCPSCETSRMPKPGDLEPVKFDPPLTEAEADAYWDAISDEPESGDPS